MFVVRLRLRGMVVEMFSAPKRHGGLLVTVKEGDCPLKILPDRFRIVISGFDHRFRILRYLVKNVGREGPRVVHVRLCIRQFRDFFYGVVEDVKDRVPIMCLPTRVKPTEVGLPGRRAKDGVPRPIVDHFGRDTVAVNARGLNVINVFFYHLQVARRYTGNVIVETVTVVACVPDAVFDPGTVR